MRNQRMIERREHLGSAFKPRQPIRIVHNRVGKDLDGNLAVEPGITRAVDLAHATRAERADDFVGAEALAASEWHGSGSASRRLSPYGRSLHGSEVGVVPVEHVLDD